MTALAGKLDHVENATVVKSMMERRVPTKSAEVPQIGMGCKGQARWFTAGGSGAR